ncbi:MAG: cytidine deaminase [Thermosediminibacterales bacterium]|nr:cytidine deaminase [Thermosediminibacterales bacterium]
MIDKELLNKAIEAKKNAYAPYSKCPVGAALLTKSGKVYTGCNIENVAYGLSNCAERTAVFKAVSEGESEFVAIAIAGNGPGFSFPCGACRQVLLEFAPKIKVIIGDEKGNYIKKELADLLPYPFEKESLKT